jgi:hypothetical protein
MHGVSPTDIQCCLGCKQVSTWQPVSAEQAKQPATYTHLQGLDTYAGKQWSGLIRDFYGATCRFVDSIVGTAGSDAPGVPTFY